MSGKLFGFIIDDEIQLDIANRRLVRIHSETSERYILFSAVSLNETLVRLLVLLLQNNHGNESRLTKDEIFKYVWETNNQSASSQRLWQAIKELREKLIVIGLPHDFIVNSRGTGYSLSNHRITPLFYN